MEARGWSWEIWNLLPSILLPTFLLHFRLVRLPPGATIPFVSPGQDRSSWGQGHTAMKREQSAGETCSGSPAGTAGQHRATRLKTAGRMAGEHQNEPGRLVVG